MDGKAIRGMLQADMRHGLQSNAAAAQLGYYSQRHGLEREKNTQNEGQRGAAWG